MLTRWFSRGERGQVLMITALLIPVLTAMAAMAADLGSYASDRRSLQNAADSIALAGAQDLCNPTCTDTTAAIASAQSWAMKNGIDPKSLTLTVSGGSTAPAISASISRQHDFWFIRMVGINSANVGARATAAKVSFGGGAGVVPWTVTQATVDGTTNGGLVTVKYDATGGNTGNFGAMRIDGSGAATYLSDAKYGANSYVCAATAPNCTTGSCPGSYPDVCAETAPQCTGPVCNPENGNMTGPTRNAVDFRMQNTIATCNTFAQAFPAQNPDGTYQLAPGCNPWINGPGGCPFGPSGIACSRRVMVIPVVNGFGNGQTPVTIQRFALVYLEGYTGSCTGNSCDVQVRFVDANLSAYALAGTYDPTASIHFVKLIQ
ncbi:MAG TPA: pilus assembly protein TadG-related protein [Dehalococcoidia bacterium]|nr:pilus assembly protein TadG-related protein [Dehalococcoidia bacterium]